MTEYGMQRVNIHLIRHGQTNWNAEGRIQGRSESDLDDTGIAQAKNLRPLINSLGIEEMYVSTSRRTRQTAELVGADLVVPTSYHDELREINLGPWETRLWEEVNASAPVEAGTFRNKPHKFELEGAETYAMLQQRGVSAIEMIRNKSQADNILVVSHGALLKVILAHYAGLPLSRLSEFPSLPNCSHSILASSDSTDGSSALVVRQMAGIVYQPA